MKIATWNVNSLRMRLDAVISWLESVAPDVVCLQEIKCTDEDFPQAAFEKAGWHTAFCGQKSYNGVAIIARGEIKDVITHLPTFKKDPQARYIEAVVDDIRIASIYVPNGNPVDSDKLPYKVSWLTQLHAHAQKLLMREEAFVLAGDYNIIPSAADVWDEAGWLDDALYRPEIKALWRKLLWLGLTDALASAHDGEENYTFWDYQKGAWAKNHGIRIDHVLLSPLAADRLTGAGVDKNMRGQEKPSDHAPVWVELEA